MLTVINGGYKPPIDKSELWQHAYYKKIYLLHLLPNYKDYIKTAVFYGINYVNSINMDATPNEPEIVFQTASNIQRLIGRLTPREFMTIFPIRKTYDGEKFECKDYFYTKSYIESFGLDTLIGDKVDEFLWDYWNIKTSIFVVQMLSAMDKIRRQQGQKSMIEEFFGDKVTTYRKFTDRNGREYLVDSKTGKYHRTMRKIPRYLNLINEESITHRLR